MAEEQAQVRMHKKSNCVRTGVSRGSPCSIVPVISSYQSAITRTHNSRLPRK